MALALTSDLSPADWIVATDVRWEQLVDFGPTVFPAYARLLFLPDPTYEVQCENDADLATAPCDGDQWQALFELLAAHTDTPDDCYFCLWDGWGFPYSLRHQPRVCIPPGVGASMRSYFLFRGPLSDAGDWGGAEFAPVGSLTYEPAFVWPADRAWCVANDVDPHWAGIGADASVIERIIADPRLDAVAADPGDDQPAYC